STGATGKCCAPHRGSEPGLAQRRGHPILDNGPVNSRRALITLRAGADSAVWALLDVANARAQRDDFLASDIRGADANAYEPAADHRSADAKVKAMEAALAQAERRLLRLSNH